VHIADVHDDGVYEAVAHIMRIGVPLWRRDGFTIPDTLEGLDDLEIDRPTGASGDDDTTR
jgi:hypothetical protein